MRQTQIATITDGVRELGGWWIDTLRPLVPAPLRLVDRTPTADIIIGRDRTEIVRIADGVGTSFVDARPVDSLDEAAWTELADLVRDTRTRLVLYAPDIYATEVVLPIQARGREDAAIDLQLDTISPLRRELILWSRGTARVDQTGLRISLMIVRRSTIDRLGALFADHGLPRPPVHGVSDGVTQELVTGQSGGRGPRLKRSVILGLAAALLLGSIPFSTGLAAYLSRSIVDARIEQLRVEVAPKLAAQRAAMRMETVKAGLRQLIREPRITAIVNELARVLPEDAYARSLRRTGAKTLSLEIDAAAPDTARDALERSARLGRTTIVNQSIGPDQRSRLIVEASVLK